MYDACPGGRCLFRMHVLGEGASYECMSWGEGVMNACPGEMVPLKNMSGRVPVTDVCPGGGVPHTNACPGGGGASYKCMSWGRVPRTNTCPGGRVSRMHVLGGGCLL